MLGHALDERQGEARIAGGRHAAAPPAGPGARRFALALGAIVLFALAGRVGYVLMVTADQEPVYVDEYYYAISAEQVLEGEGWVDPPLFGPPVQSAEHPPLTIVALLPVAAVTDGYTPMRLVVALFGAATVAVIGLLGRQVAGPGAGLVAAAIAAVYPNLWMNDGLIMSETFATLATAAAIWSTYRLLRRPAWPAAAGTGLAVGAAVLSRGELVLLLPLMVVPAVLAARAVPVARRVLLLAVVAAVAVAAAVPWVAFNLGRFEEPVFLSTGDGAVWLGANCPSTYFGDHLGSWHGTCAILDRPREKSRNASRKRERAFEYAQDHLSRLPVVVAARVGRMWSLYEPGQMARGAEGEGKPVWASLAGTASLWVLVPLAAGGSLQLRRRRVALAPLLGPVVTITVVAVVFYGIVRFRAPAEPSVVVLAAVQIHRWLRPGPPASGRAPGPA